MDRPGPITAVDGLRNSSGSSGTFIPHSAACAASFFPTQTSLGRQHRRQEAHVVERHLLPRRDRVFEERAPEDTDPGRSPVDGTRCDAVAEPETDEPRRAWSRR